MGAQSPICPARIQIAVITNRGHQVVIPGGTNTFFLMADTWEGRGIHRLGAEHRHDRGGQTDLSNLGQISSFFFQLKRRLLIRNRQGGGDEIGRVKPTPPLLIRAHTFPCYSYIESKFKVKGGSEQLSLRTEKLVPLHTRCSQEKFFSPSRRLQLPHDAQSVQKKENKLSITRFIWPSQSAGVALFLGRLNSFYPFAAPHTWISKCSLAARIRKKRRAKSVTCINTKYAD